MQPATHLGWHQPKAKAASTAHINATAAAQHLLFGISKNPNPNRLSCFCSAGSCAVVCAPTSSGKTFISSYVIQQVLKPQASVTAAATQAAVPSLRSSKGARNPVPSTAAGDARSDAAAGQLAAAAAAASAGPTSEGVVVIVLPTKALVNQLAAQVRHFYMSICWGDQLCSSVVLRYATGFLASAWWTG